MLASRLALITGAGSGIGKATCISFAKNNARIIAVDQNSESIDEMKRVLKGVDRLSTFTMDVSKSQSIAKLASKILDIYKEPPSIVVNCAGITRDNFILNMSEEAFDEVIKVNLKGTFLVLQTFGRLLVEHKIKGSIINLGSIIGKIGNVGQCNYSASKAGVELITKTAAQEFGRYGVRCNTVLPGLIKTPMIESVPGKVKELFVKKIALGRFGEPQEVVEVITFLASDKSSYVNGASIEVTGGGL